MSTGLTRNWGIYLFNGILAVLYGLFALFIPAETLQTLGWYAGLIILLGGFLILLVVINRIRQELPFTWMLVQSVLYIAAGALIMVYTTQAISIFVAVLGVLALVVGVLQLIVLVNIDPAFKSKNFMLINALVTLGFGVLMLFNPFNFAQTLVVLSGVMALFFGGILIWFSTRLRKITREFQQ
jgi:uncharacterized membrane protein HdeD (DUF308 family)